MLYKEQQNMRNQSLETSLHDGLGGMLLLRHIKRPKYLG
jgi:hypothetical protein